MTRARWGFSTRCAFVRRPSTAAARAGSGVRSQSTRGVRSQVVPVKDVHIIRLTWALPPVVAHYHSKPDEYASHLLGHEGAGSVLAELKRRGIATSLVAGISGLPALALRECVYVSLCVYLCVRVCECVCV